VQTHTQTEPERQEPFTVEIKWPDNMGCVTQPNPEQIIRAGLEAWSQLKKCKTFASWLTVGEAMLAIRTEAMRGAHVNAPEGRRYQQEFSYLLKKSRCEDGSNFEEIDKGTRSRLIECVTNRKEIETWLATLTTSERQKLNHPEAVLRRWKKATSKKPDETAPKKPSHTEKLTASIVTLEEENARMKRAIERGGGDLWTPQDTPKDIARVIFGTISRSKAREVAREINKLAREVEKTSAPQETSEVRT
jgi:hypothetical protein